MSSLDRNLFLEVTISLDNYKVISPLGFILSGWGTVAGQFPITLDMVMFRG